MESKWSWCSIIVCSLRSLWRVHPITHCDVIAVWSDQNRTKVNDDVCIKIL